MDRSLRAHVLPASITMYDWMHIYLVDGICNWEVSAFVGRLQDLHGIGFADLHSWVCNLD